MQQQLTKVFLLIIQLNSSILQFPKRSSVYSSLPLVPVDVGQMGAFPSEAANQQRSRYGCELPPCQTAKLPVHVVFIRLTVEAKTQQSLTEIQLFLFFLNLKEKKKKNRWSGKRLRFVQLYTTTNKCSTCSADSNQEHLPCWQTFRPSTVASPTPPHSAQ